MKELTVAISDGYVWKVVYRAEISHTEEDYEELKSDLEFVRKENKKLNEENEKLKETIKDHQFYEEKLEHRIIEFEELLHWE